MYDSSIEFNLNRAVEHIRSAQQVHKRELEQKDELISDLQKRVEALQYEAREFKEAKRLSEKESQKIFSTSQYIRHELSIEQAENERLKDEIERLKQDLSASEDKISYLENEQEKANHIIKNLFKKFQVKQPSPTQTPQQQGHVRHLSHHNLHHQQQPQHLPYHHHNPHQPRTSV